MFIIFLATRNGRLLVADGVEDVAVDGIQVLTGVQKWRKWPLEWKTKISEIVFACWDRKIMSREVSYYKEKNSNELKYGVVRMECA